MKKRILTGITTTGIPHLGNYVGAIRPAISQSQAQEETSFLFLADFHALIKCYDPKLIQESTLAIAATWLACGLNPEKITFYRQSDIPEIPELAWILQCVTAKGLMNRAHAYKAAVDQNVAAEQEPDHEISMGLFCYPVLMAADILMFNATHIPVGKDQIQHVEMTKDIAARFNHRYGQQFVLPEAVVEEDTPLLTGLDGRKMSKSYGNTIALFEPEKALRKQVMKIVTNSQEPHEPKNPDESVVFEIYRAFSSPEEQQAMRERYQSGIGWGEAKQALFEKINEELGEARERYHQLIENPKRIEEILQFGAEKARKESRARLEAVRAAVGIRGMGG
ncbi:MAG: tryptophan--tRNA ligase [Cardiobacteriaceae bacterium]|nr:tryptophan--tRNA ligase [Cardiobacteriaceae bacterium]